jgi:hypothetical protein
MAEECYNLPGSWTLWGVLHAPQVQGVGADTLPDGSTTEDSGGFFGVDRIWIDPAQA